MAENPGQSECPQEGKDVLKLLRANGWGTGFHNPFADEENKALEQRLEQLQRKNLLLRNATESIRENVSHLRSHEQNIYTDIRLNHEMSKAKQTHLDDERTIFIKCQKDHAFTIREHSRLTHQVKDFSERNRHRLVGFEKRQKELKNSMQQIEQDHKLIEFLRQKEFDMEDEMAQISKFKSLDKGEIQQIHKDLLVLERDNREFTQQLEIELQNTNKASDQYRRLSIEFRQAHRKRKEMLLMWNATLTAVRARDNDLQEMANEYFELHERVKGEASTQECLLAFLQSRAEEMEEIEYRSKFYEGEIRTSNEQLEKLRRLILNLKTDHLHTVSATQKLTAQNHETRQKIKVIRDEFDSRFDKEGAIKAEVEKLYEERDYIRTIANDQERLLRELESMYDAEETRSAKLEKRGVLIRKFHFEKTNERRELEEKIQTVSTRMNLINRIFARLSANEYENTSEMAKRQSRLYRADVEVSTLEVKISRLLNTAIEPRFFKLQVREDRLRSKNQQILTTNTFVAKEADRVSGILEALVNDIDAQKDRARHLDIALVETRLSVSEVTRLSQGLSEDVKERTFKYNLMKISVSRLKNSVVSFSGKIFSLAQIRSLFHTAGLERKSEIEFHVALIKKKTSMLKKEVTFLECSSYRTNTCISKLRVKFELLSGAKSGKDPGDALFNEMKAIFRDRATLKQQRFQWENQVEQDLKEIEGLKNVLEVLRGNNEAYKISLAPADQSCGGDAKLRELRSLEKRVFVYRNRCKRHIENLNTTVRNLKKEVGIAKTNIQRATAEADEKLLEMSSNKDEALYLRDRIGRWDQLISRISTDEATWRKQGLLYFIELDLNRKLVEEKYEHAMRKMLALMRRDLRIRKTIYLFLRKHGMIAQFMERFQLTEQKLFEQYCEVLRGENEDIEVCKAHGQDEGHEEEFEGEEEEDIASSIVPTLDSIFSSSDVLRGEDEEDFPSSEPTEPVMTRIPYCDELPQL